MTINYRATRYACYLSYVTHAAINTLAPLLFIIFQTRYGLSYEALGRLVLLNFVTQLVVDVVAARFVDRIGYRIPMMCAHVFAFMGLLMLSLFPLLPVPLYGGLVTAVIVYGIGGGLLEVLVSPIIDSLPAPEEEKASRMSLLHAFYSWGLLVVVVMSSVFLAFLGTDRWQMLPLFWASLPIVNFIAFSRVPLMPTVPEEKQEGFRKLFAAPIFTVMVLLLVGSGAAEQTLVQWASLLAEQGLGLPKMWGDLLGLGMFALTMGIGRTIYGVWGTKINLYRFMLFCGVLCVACYLVICLSPVPALSLLACAVSGFSVSIMWPGTLSMGAARFPMGGTAMFGIFAMSGDIGCSVGPWLAGLFADLADRPESLAGRICAWLPGESAQLQTGILFGAAFPVLFLLLLIVCKRGLAAKS